MASSSGQRSSTYNWRQMPKTRHNRIVINCCKPSERTIDQWMDGRMNEWMNEWMNWWLVTVASRAPYTVNAFTYLRSRRTHAKPAYRKPYFSVRAWWLFHLSVIVCVLSHIWHRRWHETHAKLTKESRHIVRRMKSIPAVIADSHCIKSWNRILSRGR